MKLVSRVERWRLYLPEPQGKNEEGDENEGDAELEHERHAQKNDLDIAWREDTAIECSLRQQRKRRDRENLTDFVNGKVAGVGRGRLMCWPVLIERSEWENCWARKDLETIGRWEGPVCELDV